MENETLKIYNPQDIPFGPLSNNYLSPINIDGLFYPTITNYILSNLFIVPMDRMIMQMAPIKGKPNIDVEEKLKHIINNIQIRQRRKLTQEEVSQFRNAIFTETNMQKMSIYELNNHLRYQEYFNTLSSAVNNAYNSKVSTNQKLVDLIANTGNRPIIYQSKNTLLGIGDVDDSGKYTGQNFIGKTIMQIRHNLKKQKEHLVKKEEENKLNDKIYESYIAYTILTYELSLGNNIKSFRNKTPADIVKEYVNLEKIKFSGKNVVVPANFLEKDTVIEMYNRDKSMIKDDFVAYDILSYFTKTKLIMLSLRDPSCFSMEIYKLGLQYIKKQGHLNRIQIIFSQYVRYFISKKFKNLTEQEVTQAIDELIFTIPIPNREKDPLLKSEIKMYRQMELDKLKTFVKNSYDKNLLDEELTIKIKEQLDTLYIPTDEEIKEASIISPNCSTSSEEEKEEKEEEKEEEPTNDTNKKLINILSGKNSEKDSLINDIMKKSGETREDLEKLSVDELKKYKPAGHWITKIKNKKTNLVEIVAGPSKDKPNDNDKNKIVNDYNKKNKTQIKTNQLFFSWVRDKQEQKQQEEKQQEEKIFVKPEGEPFVITPDEKDPLSPLFRDDFIVDKLSYPCVSIYLTTILLTHEGKTMDIKKHNIISRGMTVEKARSMMIENNFWHHPDKCNEIYERVKSSSEAELLSTFTRRALAEKFKDVSLQKLLLMTGKKDIIWNDPNSFFLGSGTKEKPGMNEAGKILQELREKIKMNPPISYDVSIEKITNFIINDDFMFNWSVMRLKDMCNTVYKMKDYLENIANQKENIDNKFIEITINNIYKPLHSNIPLIETKIVPDIFINEVLGCKGLSEIFTKNFKQEAIKISDQLSNLDQDNFTEKKEPPEVEKSLKFLTELNNKINNTENKEEKDRLQVIRDKHITNIFLVKEGRSKGRTIEDPFMKKQRKEWLDYIEEINKPASSQKDIQIGMDKLKEKHKKKLAEMNYNEENPTQKMIAEVEKQKQEIEDKWALLNQPEKSINERNKLLQEYADQQHD